ncbi:MAG: hypothetical protein ACRCXH_04890 [Shewanella sp.]
MRILLTLAALACSSTVIAKEPSKQVRELLALTPEMVEAKISVTDDPLETHVKVSSFPVWSEKRGLLKIVWEDNFLRGFVDRKTGKATVQVYHSLSYIGDWKFYDTVNYEMPDGLKSAKLDRLDSKALGCGRSGCTLSEVVGFELPSEVLERAKHDPANPKAWFYRLKSKTGQDFNSGISAVEMEGFYRALVKVQAKYGLAK